MLRIAEKYKINLGIVQGSSFIMTFLYVIYSTLALHSLFIRTSEIEVQAGCS